MLRALLFTLFQIITVVPIALCCLICAPLPLAWRYRLSMTWPRLQIWAARVLLGIRWQVIGQHHLPQGAAILLSKHQSTWETLFYPGFMPRELCYVFKRELLYLPFFGWGIALLDMIHIDRKKGSNAFEHVVAQGIRKLEQGDCWGRNSFIKTPGLITVSIGRPNSPEGKDAFGLMQEVENWIDSEMRVITPRAYAHETSDTEQP